MNKQLLISMLLGFISTQVMAEADFSAIEEQERAQIIKELSYRLATKKNCDQTLNWDDSGSGGDQDGYFFIPNASGSEYIIGGHASGKRASKFHCTITVSEVATNPEGTPPLLVKPADWKQVWKDSGSGAAKDGSFWNAIPPDDNYVCIGSVSQLSHNAKPNLSNYRCVHKTLANKTDVKSIVWSDKGTGADKQVTIFHLHSSGSFYAVPTRAGSTSTYDLKKDATNIPDAQTVEAILEKRLAPLKAGVEAKAKAMQEEKASSKKAEAEKAAAKKAEQEKLAVAEAKKKQEAEQKALAAQVETEEKVNEEAEAQKLKEEQQARIAKAKAEKEAKEKAAQEAKAKAAAEKAEKEAMTKATEEKKVEESKPEVVEETSEPEVEEPAMTSTDTSSKSKGESKGLDDIMNFFLKVFGMMIGGVIIFMIAFKVLFGKRKES
jgi:VPS62-like protein